MSKSPQNPFVRDDYKARLRAFSTRAAADFRALRVFLSDRMRPVDAPDWAALTPPAAVPVTTPPLDREAAAWVNAHRDAEPTEAADRDQSASPATAMIFADQSVQNWMGETLSNLGWEITEPVFITEGWVPARGEEIATGQPVVTYTTPSKTSHIKTSGKTAAAYARRNDPASSKTAGALAAASNSITVTSHQGQLLFAYATQHATNPGTGLTAAEAVNAADLLTDGATGSPWRRVTDLRDMGLVTFLLDGTGERTSRKNDSNSDGQVLVITPLGLRAAAALGALREHGYLDYPLNFDGPADATLFEELADTLARIDTMLPAPVPAPVLAPAPVSGADT